MKKRNEYAGSLTRLPGQYCTAINLLWEIELLIRVNAPMMDGSPIHKKILAVLKSADK